VQKVTRRDTTPRPRRVDYTYLLGDKKPRKGGFRREDSQDKGGGVFGDARGGKSYLWVKEEGKVLFYTPTGRGRRRGKKEGKT